jgi:hypothetical protein
VDTVMIFQLSSFLILIIAASIMAGGSRNSFFTFLPHY